MAVTGTYTARQICTRALRKIGVVAIDEEATADILEVAREGLDLMLKSWQNKGVNVFLKSSMSVPCTTNRNYTLDPVRPLEIETVRYKDSSELTMERMTRAEYDRLPVKTTNGIPTQFYYDRQREAAVLYVWPVPASVTTQTLEITYIRELEDVAFDDVVDLPGEMWNAAVYCLADELADDFPAQNPALAERVARKAFQLRNEALAFDREGSIFFAGPYAG